LVRSGRRAPTTIASSKVVSSTSIKEMPASAGSRLRPRGDLGIVPDLGLGGIADAVAVAVDAGGDRDVHERADALGRARGPGGDGPDHEALGKIRADRRARRHARDVVPKRGDRRLHLPDGDRAQARDRLIRLILLEQPGEQQHQGDQGHGDEQRGDEHLDEAEPRFAPHGPVTWTNPVAAVTDTEAVAAPEVKVTVALGEAAPFGVNVTCWVPVTVTPARKVLGKSGPAVPPC